MFRLLRKIFGTSGGTAAPAAPPLPSTQQPSDEHPPAPVLCREAVLDRDQRLVGYQFSHHRGTRSRAEHRGRGIRHIYAEVLVRSLASFGLERGLGRRLAFVELPDSFLGHASLGELSTANLVVLLRADENDPATDSLPAHVDALRRRGARIGLFGDRLAERHVALLPQAEVLVFSEGGSDPAALARHIHRLHAARPEAAILVRDLASHDDFELASKLGGGLFQGAFVTARQPWEQHGLGPNAARLADMLARLRRDADTRELAEALKRDGALSVRLLRYINSAAVGLHEKVTSFEHALQLLGRARLERWLMLLMLSADGNSPRSGAVLEGAMVRARMMELLGRHEPAEVRDELFMTGLLSLIDVVLEMPMTEAMRAFDPPAAIRAAIVDGEGRLAELLALAQACEQAVPEALEWAAERCGIAPERAGLCHVEALAWALEMGD